MKKFLGQILAATLGLWLAIEFLPGVQFQGSSLDLVFIGVILAFFNLFLKPILNFLTFPLKILTFGLFSLIINMAIIWLVDSMFEQLAITNLFSLFLTSLIIGFTTSTFAIFFK